MSTFGSPNPSAAIVAEWVSKAEADFELARREIGFAGARNLDAIGFHLQQAIEKLMKAVLIRRGTQVPRTHDLTLLDRQLSALGIGPLASANDLARLSIAAVQARYPGCSLTAADVIDLEGIANSIWRTLRPLV